MMLLKLLEPQYVHAHLGPPWIPKPYLFLSCFMRSSVATVSRQREKCDYIYVHLNDARTYLTLPAHAYVVGGIGSGRW